MKRKKITFCGLTAAFILTALSVFGQEQSLNKLRSSEEKKAEENVKRWFVKGGSGYSAALGLGNKIYSAGQDLFTLGKFANISNINKASGLVDNLKQTYGKGVNFNLGGGRNLSKYIAAELDLSYLLGAPVEGTIQSSYNHPDIGQVGIDMFSSSKAKLLSLRPAVTINPNLKGAFQPYLKLGAIVGLVSEVKTETKMEDAFGNDFLYREKVSGKPGLGYTGGIGVNYQMTPTVSLYAETAVNQISIKPNKTEITALLVNGVDMRGSENKDIRYNGESVEFGEPFFSDGSRGAGDGYRAPFNNVTFSAGVITTLGKNRPEEAVFGKYHRLRSVVLIKEGRSLIYRGR